MQEVRFPGCWGERWSILHRQDLHSCKTCSSTMLSDYWNPSAYTCCFLHIHTGFVISAAPSLLQFHSVTKHGNKEVGPKVWSFRKTSRMVDEEFSPYCTVLFSFARGQGKAQVVSEHTRSLSCSIICLNQLTLFSSISPSPNFVSSQTWLRQSINPSNYIYIYIAPFQTG